MTTSAEQAAAETYEAWRQAWLSVDKVAMKRLFDPEHPGFTYQAEEAEGALHTFEELDGYWDRGAEVLTEVAEWRELSRKLVVEGNIAILFASLQTTLSLSFRPTPLEGEVRVSMVMHERDGEWKITHYHESRRFNPAAV